MQQQKSGRVVWGKTEQEQEREQARGEEGELTVGRRGEKARVGGRVSLSPENGSLWLADGIAGDPTLAPGLPFRSCNTENLAQL